MKENLNNIFENFNVKAKCVSHTKLSNYEYYDCYLSGIGRFSDIISIKNEIQIGLRIKNINIKMIPEDSMIRIESFSSRSGQIKYESILRKRISKTECFLGKDYYGNTVSLDIANCPHLLIGGTSGSGKTILLNNIIRNLLDEDVRLFLCDPKKIDFNKYENSESNISVFYTEEATIKNLEYLVKIMEYNFDIISKYGPEIVKPTVLIIDEYADLVSSNKGNIIHSYVKKLSQKSRAAKIHIIVSTQRPSTTIISGDIKSNFPTRIALKTASSHDSKIIIDEFGAEELLGKGDAIIKDMYGNFTRFQSCI